MTYDQLISQYFERSTALQNYWTLYVVVIGGLLAVAALRREPDLIAGVLVTGLFCAFAYKNLGAIEDATLQRMAIVGAVRQSTQYSGSAETRQQIEATLVTPSFESIRTFHVACDATTVALLWALQVRRWRAKSPAAAKSTN